MTPRRPSEPSTISRTLGPDDDDGSGRSVSTWPGITMVSPRQMSAMSPYLSDCMPEERVAIQPPSVDHTNESGWCPMVQPRAFSWSSMSGPNTPAWTWASPDTSSISSTLLMRPRLTEITWRVSPGSASRAETMFEPPPKGMSTASAATTASTRSSTSRWVPG